MHDKTIEKVPAASLKALLEKRLEGIAVPKTVLAAKDGDLAEEPNPEYERKVKYETDRLAYGFNASCDCGWEANNPLPSEADAEEAVAEHYAAVNQAMGG